MIEDERLEGAMGRRVVEHVSARKENERIGWGGRNGTYEMSSDRLRSHCPFRWTAIVDRARRPFLDPKNKTKTKSCHAVVARNHGSISCHVMSVFVLVLVFGPDSTYSTC